MSFRKKILYKISPTYRNTAIFRDRTAKILDQLERFSSGLNLNRIPMWRGI